MKQKLEMELERIKYAISNNAFDYLFLVSNEEKIRSFFITNISNIDEINTVDDIQMTQEELKKKLENKKGILYVENETKEIDNDNSLYYNLVTKREFLWNNKKTIITVCDEKTSISLLSTNGSLRTASWFYFLDDLIKDKNISKRLIK